jgi:hypothetical protein
LRRLIATVDPADVRSTELRVGHVTLELVNLWSNFVRAYYLSCALNARVGRRQRIRTTRTFTSTDDALRAAVLRFKPAAARLPSGGWSRRDEPDWKNTGILLTLASEGGWSNESTVAAALSIKGIRSIFDLPTFRNFYAHRNRETLEAARLLGARYGIPQYRRLSEILLSVPVAGRDLLLIEWIGELDIIIEWLCE